MKKYVGLMFMALAVSHTTAFSGDNSTHVIVQKGAVFPITQLTIFVPVGSASFDKKGGESAILEDILAYSPITKTIENYGGDYSISFSKDAFSIQISLLTEELSSFLPKLKETLDSLKIGNKDIELARKHVAEEIHSIDGNPERKSSLLFYQKIFGSHPYGQSRLGTLKSLAEISLGDLSKIWQLILGDSSRIYIIAASNEPEKIHKSLKTFWESFPKNSLPISPIPPVTIPNKPLSFSEKDPHSSQSFVHIGLLIPRIPFMDRPFPLLLADIIGGGFNSRLFTILRAEHGLSYSPHAYYRSQVGADLLDIAYSTKSSSTKESLSIVENILKDLEEHGVTEKEFETTKKLVYNRLLRLQEDNQSLNQLVAGDILYKNPSESIKILEQRVRDCTLESLNNFVKPLLKNHPRLQVVLEGS